MSSRKEIIQKAIRENILLISILALTSIATIVGVRYWISAQVTPIPQGYSVLSYFNALEDADSNDDGEINTFDLATTLDQYGKQRPLQNSQFGDTVDARIMSFQIENLGIEVNSQKASILTSEENRSRYTTDLVVANENLFQVPHYARDDKEYNASLSQDTVLGESIDSTGAQPGGEGTGSKGADSGRTVIPSVLGTVSSYTGTAGFDYPIRVPAGPGGLSPALSVGYSSGAIDDVLPFDDKYVSGQRDSDGTPVNSYYYKDKLSYAPFYAGYGFSVNGGGSIVRDTRQEKDVYMIKGDVHHRFLLNLPSGLSAELKYNPLTKRWVSIPEGFVKIEHSAPAVLSKKTTLGDGNGLKPFLDGLIMPGSDFILVDADEWIITTSDGNRYYFGEQKLQDKISVDGGIIGRDLITARSERKDGSKYDAVHHAVTNNGGIFNEYDIADVCTGGSSGNPCSDWKTKDGQSIPGRFSNDKPVLLTSKWLLRRMETSDGRDVTYKYDSYQKYYGDFYQKKWSNKLDYATVDSYLKEISWNDNKHRVVLTREARPDSDDRQFVSLHRLAKIEVQTKLQSDGQFHLVRRYDLKYVNDDSAMEVDGDRNEWNASLLKSIQEFGTDGTTKLPAVTFKYKAYGFEDGPSGSTLYLSAIKNGYGGETHYAYQPFTYPLVNGSGDSANGPRRLRVIEKKVVDKTVEPNKSFREVYDYHDANGNESSWGFADRIRGKHTTGREFLGHSQVDVKTYDFDSDKILSHSKTQFYQFNAEQGTKEIKRNCLNGECQNSIEKGFVCFEPHMNKGQPSLQIAYNQLPGGGEIEASRQITKYNYRILDWDSSNRGVIKEDNLNVDAKKCTGIGMNQPYFVFAKSVTTTVNEPKSADFDKVGVLANLKETPSNTKTIRTENLNYDVFGNLLKNVSYGDIDENGRDINPADNRYSYGYYLTGNLNWINNLAYVSYSSPSGTCAPDDFACQYGRTETWYDRFYTDLPTINIWDQKPSLGFVTQVKSFVDTDANHDTKHNDPIVAYAGTEYLRLSTDPTDHDARSKNDTSDQRRGGPVKMYGPKPNSKSVDSVNDQTVLIGQTHYDDYYHTLVEESQNALGHTTKLEDYDYLLQTPRESFTQISSKPDAFSSARVEFDSLGRVVALFGPNPSDVSKTFEYPMSVMSQFDDGGDRGLMTRQMSLVSQTADGKLHYSSTDSFYDGLGRVKQTQVLSKLVEGKPKRLVSDVQYNALGQQVESYEVQVIDPVQINAIKPDNYQQIIRSTAPSYASIPHVILAKTKFDGLNRPVQAMLINTETNSEMITASYYYVNAQKTVNPKNVATITTSDSLGRPSDALVIDPSGDQHSIFQNVYGQTMIDKPTTTIYRSIKELAGGNTSKTEITYDKSGRVLVSNEPSLGTTELSYDVLGNIINVRRSPREDIVSQYDVLGRLIKTTYEEGSNDLFNKIAENKSDVMYIYDTAPNALGKLVSVSHHMGKDELSYDAMGRQVSVKKTISDKTYETTNHYNDVSQIVSVDYPDNYKYASIYDLDGVVQKTQLNGKDLASGTIFDKSGHSIESKFVLGAHTYLSRTPYDTMGRLKELGFARVEGSQEVPYFYQQFQYDAVSQLSPLTEITYKNGTEDRTDYTYTYDAFARLTKAQSSKYTTSYSYDPFGRIQTKSEGENIAYTYTSAFPYFAPKSMTIPQTDSPLPTPTQLPSPSQTQTPTVKVTPKPTLTPTPTTAQTPTPTKVITQIPTVSTTPTPTKAQTPTPTQAPVGCLFEPVASVKERMPDGTYRPLTSAEAKDIMTINDKRKAKYDANGTKREFWTPFSNGYVKACPVGGCNMEGKELCCVDETNQLPYAYQVGVKDAQGKIAPKTVEANLYIKDFGGTLTKFSIIDKYCTNMNGASGCPPNTDGYGGLREPGVPVTEIHNLQIGCNKRYEYGWIVVKSNPISSLINRFLPSKRGRAQESNTPQITQDTVTFKYNSKGALLEDDKQCYTYNRLSQLIALSVKKSPTQSCASSQNDFVTTVYFYYDYAGILVMKEEYKPNKNQPVKKVYYFGFFEDEYNYE